MDGYRGEIMRIADKVFTSLVQRQAQAKKTREGNETTQQKPKQGFDEIKSSFQSLEEPKSATNVKARDVADDLIRDRMEAKEDQNFGRDVLAKLRDMSTADKLSIMQELKSREDALNSVQKTNQAVFPKGLTDFLG